MGAGMETSAAIYIRRSAMDDREGDNRSLAGQERECREWAAEVHVPAAKGEVGPNLPLAVETVWYLAMLDSAGRRWIRERPCRI